MLSCCKFKSNCILQFVLLTPYLCICSHFKDFLFSKSHNNLTRLQDLTDPLPPPHSCQNCVFLTQTHSRPMHLCTSLHCRVKAALRSTPQGGAALRSTPQGGLHALRSTPQGGLHALRSTPQGCCSEEHTTGEGSSEEHTTGGRSEEHTTGGVLL